MKLLIPATLFLSKNLIQVSASVNCAYKFSGAEQIPETWTPKDANDLQHTSGGRKAITKRLKMVRGSVLKNRRTKVEEVPYGYDYDDGEEEIYYNYDENEGIDVEEYMNYDDEEQYNTDYNGGETYVDYTDESSVDDTIPRVIVLLDTTDSMQKIERSTVDSYNEWVDKNRNIKKGETHTPKFTSISFAYWFKANNWNDISNADRMSYSDYRAEGCTSLYDAIGCAIDQFSEENGNMFAVVTDGVDTCSEIFTDSEIKRKVEYMEANKGWQFSFIGSVDINSQYDGGYQALAESMGFKKSLGFSTNPRGMRTMFSKLSRTVNGQRQRASEYAFNHSERRQRIAKKMRRNYRLKKQQKQNGGARKPNGKPNRHSKLEARNSILCSLGQKQYC